MESTLPAGPGPGAGESRELGRPGTPAGSSDSGEPGGQCRRGQCWGNSADGAQGESLGSGVLSGGGGGGGSAWSP